MKQQCLQSDCNKPRAEPFEYCLPHFADAMVDFYIAGLKAGIKMPAWSNDCTGFGEWKMKPAKQGKRKGWSR
jgi:hypothetical protein